VTKRASTVARTASLVSPEKERERAEVGTLSKSRVYSLGSMGEGAVDWLSLLLLLFTRCRSSDGMRLITYIVP
jgi:hypothetical protein